MRGRTQRGLLLLVAALSLLGAACGGDDGGGSDGAKRETPDPTGEREVPVAATAGSDPLAIAIQADNSADDGPFPTFDDDVGFAGYTGSAYQVGVDPADSSTVAGYGPDDYGTDTTIEAWLDSTASPTDAAFGVVCRLQDEGRTYYRFGVGNDGTYAITLVVDEEATILTGAGEWVASDLIDPSSRFFIVVATCIDDRLTLTVNNEEIDSVTDPTLLSGGIGVFAKTFTEPDASVDLSVFGATGYLEPDQVDTDARDEFEHMFGSRPDEIERCELRDVADLDIDTDPLFVATCDGIVYAYTDRPADAKRIYGEILDQAGVELTETDGFPDCTRRTDVRGPFGRRDGSGEVACVDIGDETVVLWYHEGGFVGALRVPDDADDEFAAGWADDWWPLTMEMKPG